MDNINITNNTNVDLNMYYDELIDIIKYVIKQEEKEDSFVSLVFTNNEEIRNINKEYRNIDDATDVLSFALNDDIVSTSFINVLGDIIISVDKVEEQSKKYNHSFKRELFFLTVHGLLHLLGYDHDEEEKEKEMFRLQDEILEEFKIEN